MGKKLAIRGHSTRGKEVIKLLEMMGGNNCFHLCGLFSEHAYYFIGGPHNDEIRAGDYIFDEYAVLQMIDDMCFFTLEEFLEKFPFKVGDRVLIPEYESEVRICKMRWDSLCSYVEYMVYRNEEQEWYTAEELLNYNDDFLEDKHHSKKETMEEKKINQMSLANCDLDEVEIVLGDRFELKTKDGKYYAVRKKSKYPTTYKECCDVLLIPPYYNLRYHTYERGYNEYATSNELLALQDKLNTLGKLIICRNAYWKIAGEEMGLGKPWKPDLENEELYCIQNYNKQITISRTNTAFNKILIFPTEEMRDAFYENFKDLIEQCKELL